MNDWAVLIVVFGVVFISSPLIAIIHELGHALAYLWLTKPGKIDIYIGSYGSTINNIQFNIGKLYFFIKRSFPFVKGIGLCRSYKPETNYLNDIVILLAGPVVTFLTAGVFTVVMLLSPNNLYVTISCYVFLTLSFLSLIGNLVPRNIDTSGYYLSNPDAALENDGKQIAFNLKIKNTRPAYIEALTFMDAGQYDLAIEKLKYVSDAAPGSQKILRLISTIALLDKQYETAELYLNQLQDKFQLTANDLVQKGCVRSFTKRHDEAIEIYSKALKLNKNNILALNNIGYELVEKGAHQVAKRALERAIKFKPTFDHPYNNLGYSKILQGDLEEGKMLVEKCIQINDKNADAYKSLGIYYLRTKNIELANSNFKIAVELDENIDLSAYDEELEQLSATTHL